MEIFGACAACLFADLKLSEEPCAHCNWENDKFQRMPTSAEILALRARAETAEAECNQWRNQIGGRCFGVNFEDILPNIDVPRLCYDNIVTVIQQRDRAEAALAEEVARLSDACTKALDYIQTNGVGTWPEDMAIMETLRAALEARNENDH